MRGSQVVLQVTATSVPPVPARPPPPPGDSKTWKIVLPTNASPETTAGWLAYNRLTFLLKIVEVRQDLTRFIQVRSACEDVCRLRWAGSAASVQRGPGMNCVPQLQALHMFTDRDGRAGGRDPPAQRPPHEADCAPPRLVRRPERRLALPPGPAAGSSSPGNTVIFRTSTQVG